MKESAENYLERILVLESQQQKVKSIDLAKELGFSKPSVSIAVKKLREAGLIAVDGDGYISFTLEGRQKAVQVYEKHNLIKKIFISIGVPPDIAERDACKIEHQLSEITFQKIKERFSPSLG